MLYVSNYTHADKVNSSCKAGVPTNLKLGKLRKAKHAGGNNIRFSQVKRVTFFQSKKGPAAISPALELLSFGKIICSGANWFTWIEIRRSA